MMIARSKVAEFPSFLDKFHPRYGMAFMPNIRVSVLLVSLALLSIGHAQETPEGGPNVPADAASKQAQIPPGVTVLKDI